MLYFHICISWCCDLANRMPWMLMLEKMSLFCNFIGVRMFYLHHIWTKISNSEWKITTYDFNLLYGYFSVILYKNITKIAKENMSRVHLKFLNKLLGLPKCSSADMFYLTWGVNLYHRSSLSSQKHRRIIGFSVLLTGYQLNLLNQMGRE